MRSMHFTMSKQESGIFVVDTQQERVLSFQTSQDLGVVKIVLNVDTTANYKARYAKVFNGLGCFSKPFISKWIDPYHQQ